jgi:phenylpropionate dioxygenase-like ring-hydroxylating dioxygenase large terminal subunit
MNGLPPYPNGWFRVASSREVGPGAVKPLHYFGRDLVVFRGEDGVAHVLDAHYPHLGAHLGHGSRVEGGAVRCPFHAWLWNGDGRRLEVPYATRPPARAAVRSWPVREVNGLILVYYHTRQEPPDWEIPELPEYSALDPVPPGAPLDDPRPRTGAGRERHRHGPHAAPASLADPGHRQRGAGREGTKKAMQEGGRTIEEDIPIWENKAYRSAPLLCDGDGPIMRYRQWTRQFYSEPA